MRHLAKHCPSECLQEGLSVAASDQVPGSAQQEADWFEMDLVGFEDLAGTVAAQELPHNNGCVSLLRRVSNCVTHSLGSADCLLLQETMYRSS